MRQLAQTTGQAVADLAQGVGLGQLTEQHGRQLGPAGESFGMAFALVLGNQGRELVARDLLQKLTEEAGCAYHRYALRVGKRNRDLGRNRFCHNLGGRSTQGLFRTRVKKNTGLSPTTYFRSRLATK
jgi:hypothetical protein